MLNLAIFASGKGSNFRAIHAAAHNAQLDARIILLVSDKEESGAVAYAGAMNIPIHVTSASERNTSSYGADLTSLLARFSVDHIALCGYLKLLPSDVVRAFPNRIVNIHPALLPSFGGKGMYGMRVHEAVLASGAKFSGPTVHIVTEEYDRGPIVAQRIVPVLDTDTPASLAARVLKEELVLYPSVLQDFAHGRITVHGQRTFRSE